MALFDKNSTKRALSILLSQIFDLITANPFSNVWLNKMFFEYSSAFVQPVTKKIRILSVVPQTKRLMKHFIKTKV